MLRSHTFAESCPLAETSHCPFGLNATESTEDVCPFKVRILLARIQSPNLHRRVFAAGRQSLTVFAERCALDSLVVSPNVWILCPVPKSHTAT